MSLQKRELLGLSLAHWIVLITLLAGSFTLLTLIGGARHFVAKRVIKPLARRQDWDDWYQGTRWPAISVLTILIQFLSIPPLGYPLTFRVIYARIGARGPRHRAGLAAAARAGTGFHACAWSGARQGTRQHQVADATGATHDSGGHRGGRDRHRSSSCWASRARRHSPALGVVGVALALGAQKTVENLLGGVFLLTDKALAVGDYCTIGNQSGVIEDVTLRSVRMRT